MMYKSDGLLCDATSLVENAFDMLECVDRQDVSQEAESKGGRLCMEQRKGIRGGRGRP